MIEVLDRGRIGSLAIRREVECLGEETGDIDIRICDIYVGSVCSEKIQVIQTIAVLVCATKSDNYQED